MVPPKQLIFCCRHDYVFQNSTAASMFDPSLLFSCRHQSYITCRAHTGAAAFLRSVLASFLPSSPKCELCFHVFARFYFGPNNLAHGVERSNVLQCEGQCSFNTPTPCAVVASVRHCHTSCSQESSHRVDVKRRHPRDNSGELRRSCLHQAWQMCFQKLKT